MSADIMKLKCIFTILILSCNGLKMTSGEENDTRCIVQVELFYDTFCPDVINFIQGQLYSVWDELSDIMEIHWKPYGFTQVSMQFVFVTILKIIGSLV